MCHDRRKKIMKITIAGVGAMGGRYALMLSRAGNDVDGIDGWADNVNAINEHGLQANFDGEQVVAKIKAKLIQVQWLISSSSSRNPCN